MCPSVSLKEEIGSLTRGCVRARKQVLWVLLGTQYESQCEAKTRQCFGPNEVGNWVHDKRLSVYKAADSVGPSASVAELPTHIPLFLPGITNVIPGSPWAQYSNLIYPGTPF